MLRKRQTFTLAVRIPQDTPPSSKYPTITYPLQPTTATTTTQPAPSPAAAAHLPNTCRGAPAVAATDDAVSRDKQATRKFAILTADVGENPWDLGPWENWKAVMGTRAIEWLLPLRHSPCCNHDSMVSEYPLGPLLGQLRQRYGVPDLDGRVPL
ncbi:hypothetical protein E4U41_005882 [Claviceps citrina]|nr:hypothetical protein E4U41_005882 [Claviceps citrina]